MHAAAGELALKHGALDGVARELPFQKITGVNWWRRALVPLPHVVWIAWRQSGCGRQCESAQEVVIVWPSVGDLEGHDRGIVHAARCAKRCHCRNRPHRNRPHRNRRHLRRSLRQTTAELCKAYMPSLQLMAMLAPVARGSAGFSGPAPTLNPLPPVPNRRDRPAGQTIHDQLPPWTPLSVHVENHHVLLGRPLLRLRGDLCRAVHDRLANRSRLADRRADVECGRRDEAARCRSARPRWQPNLALQTSKCTPTFFFRGTSGRVTWR